ncbi:MAG TPA: glycosyltransferase [Bryobacteraceae bacterium]
MERSGSELVSVIIPCYNPGPFLMEAIASVSAQTHKPIELIVVDDGTSAPEGIRLLEQAERLADRYIEQENRGLGAARNAGFRAASGRFVVPLDADDRIEPSYVVECMRALDAATDAAFAYTDYRVFGAKNYTERTGEYNLHSLLHRNFLTYAALIRKDDWERAGGYDESMRLGYEDWEFWLRLGSRGRFGRHVPRTLFRYRRQGQSLYDVALAHHAEIVGYIQVKHPELYGYEAQALIKAQWSPTVCILGPTGTTQTILDVETIASPGTESPADLSRAAAFLLPAPALAPDSAELAALAIWGGSEKELLPDGSTALSRSAARRPSRAAVTNHALRQDRRVLGNVGRHLENAGLLSWSAWRDRPLVSLGRLVPLRVKERINRATGRPVFDLSFYLQFQPQSVGGADSIVDPLRYFPAAAKRQRIALIVPHLGPNGAKSVLFHAISALPRERYELLLLATHSRDDAWSARWRQHVDHVYDLARYVPPERMSAAVYSVIANWRCRAVVVQNSLYGYAALPFLKRARPDIRAADVVHAVSGDWDQVASTANVADALDIRIAVSESVRKRLLESGGRVRLIPNGVDLDRFRPRDARKERPKSVLFAGRLDPVKRPLLLVEIASKVADVRKKRDFQFVVAGEGPERGALEKAIRDRGLQDVFRLLGHVEDTAALFADCDAVILPSRIEGVPLVILEAMASGVPVIASDTGAIRETVGEDCGLLVDIGEGDAERFAVSLNDFLSDADLARRTGAAGRKRAEAGYGLAQMVEAYVRVFEELIRD